MLYHETPFYVISTWCRLRLIEAIRVPGTVLRATRPSLEETCYSKGNLKIARRTKIRRVSKREPRYGEAVQRAVGQTSYV
jgi:hypothetical protein